MGMFHIDQAYWSSPPLTNLSPPLLKLMKYHEQITLVLLSFHSSIKTQQKKLNKYKIYF